MAHDGIVGSTITDVFRTGDVLDTSFTLLESDLPTSVVYSFTPLGSSWWQFDMTPPVAGRYFWKWRANHSNKIIKGEFSILPMPLKTFTRHTDGRVTGERVGHEHVNELQRELERKAY